MTQNGNGQKKSVYFPENLLNEIQRECIRQDRTFSWLIQRAWDLSANEIKRYPASPKSVRR